MGLFVWLVGIFSSKRERFHTCVFNSEGDCRLANKICMHGGINLMNNPMLDT